MKGILYLLFASTLFVLFYGCSSTKRLSKTEDFESFSKRFYTDSIFQYNRITFPLKIEEHMAKIE
jgi:hypothetical protein